MLELSAKNIRLASGNRRLMQSRSGRWFMDSTYRKRRAELIALFKRHLPRNHKTIETSAAVYVDVKTYKDIDNVLKTILDVLQELEVFSNDGIVDTLIVSRERIKRNNPESVTVRVEEKKTKREGEDG